MKRSMSRRRCTNVARVGTSVTAVASQNNRRRGQNRSNRSQRSRRDAERVVPGPVAHPDIPGPLAWIDTVRVKNRRWPLTASVVIALIVGVLAALVGIPFSPVIAVIVGVIVGLAVFFGVRKAAPAGTMRAIAGPIAPAGSLPRVETLLSGLGVTMGVSTPSISILVDEVPNAASFGSRSEPRLLLTTGLLDTMSVVELEGVLAHLLAHQRLDAVERGTFGAGLALLLGGIGRRRAHRFTGDHRLYSADEVACIIDRYPPGLASALQKMEQASLPSADSFFASGTYDTLRWLFIDPSIARRASTDEVGDLDATGVRRRVLAER